ncbi:heme biosynthesis HemY N-terminal domain-containing protein [Acuticoccus sp. MNP-M23]|uniref:heme biosynthesis protein HemY n=1 Tax=Acuticoccus sp. MNP-M23 TaxID=3072793 RepID=UPI0028154696|nr:heme biosynthesis HemY N-terminal domain-containing protein [Acuticoccus sp. MNP-M23]WMS41547.1 heme biosynthesis HemY N-terminal domain-containing protein [Acuticoccus sp. MNP-M23]
MVRLLILLAVLFGAATVAAFLADNPGTITYRWGETAGTLSTTEAAALALGAAVALLLMAEVAKAMWRLPRTIRRRRDNARAARTARALSAGVLAIGTGHARAASRAAADALAAAPAEPLAHFVAAQAAQLSGDSAAARQHFLALAEVPETRALGLRGLTVEAERAGDLAAMRTLAADALAHDPALHWAAETSFTAAAAAGDFPAALAQLETNHRNKLVDRAAHRRLRAVLLTAEAMTLPRAEAARSLALEAHNLAKDFVPAALIAASAVATKNRRQAASILIETYRLSPHPDVFRAALDLEAGPAGERLKRARTFAGARPEHIESALGLARAALSAREPELARETIAPHLAGATQRVCILMAELEALAPGDEGRVRDWLARAVRAPKDPVWFADGVTAKAWAPVSPVTGRLDAFVWRVPPTLGEPPVPAVDFPAPLAQPPAQPSLDDQNADDTQRMIPGPSVPLT